VSKAKNEQMKKRAQAPGSWMWCVKKAREDLNLKGFVAIKKGTPLYDTAKILYNNGGNYPAGKAPGVKSPKTSSRSPTVKSPGIPVQGSKPVSKEQDGGWSAFGC